MTDLLTALPVSLARSVLADWLELRYVAHLDTAMLRKATRKPFLELLRTTVFPSVGFSYTEKITFELGSLYKSTITWLVTRSVRVMTLDVTWMYREEALLKKVLTHTGYCLKSVRLTDYELQAVAANCSHLQRVEYWHSALDFPLVHRLLSHNLHIQHLEFSELFVAPWSFLNYTTKCPELRVLCVSLKQGSYESFVLPFILSLLVMSPKLHTLTLKCGLDNQNIMQLLPKCVHLRSLSLHDALFDDATLLEIVTQCSQIINLDLTSARNITDSGVTHAAKFLSLQSICLDEIGQLTVRSLSAVSEHSSATLTALSVVNAFLSTNAGSSEETLLRQSMCGIMTSCTKLSTLCARDRYLCCSHLHTLTKLRVHFRSITHEHLAAIANNCSAVQYLCVEGYIFSCDAKFIANVRMMLDSCSKLHTLVVLSDTLSDTLYPIVERILEEDKYRGRVPTINLSMSIDDMNLSVLGMPID